MTPDTHLSLFFAKKVLYEISIKHILPLTFNRQCKFMRIIKKNCSINYKTRVKRPEKKNWPNSLNWQLRIFIQAIIFSGDYFILQKTI